MRLDCSRTAFGVGGLHAKEHELRALHRAPFGASRDANVFVEGLCFEPEPLTITRPPTASPASPASSMTPAPSLPSTSGVLARGCPPDRTVYSSGVTPAAVTRTSTLSFAGCGLGNSVCR